MSFAIENFWLTSIEKRLSPNVGGKVSGPSVIVIHYTADISHEGAVSWFANKSSGVSAHLVIGADGRVTQQVAFDTVAWHAGRSIWRGHSGVNKFSIGIELVNAGKLTERRGVYYTPYSNKPIPAEDVTVLNGVGWHKYAAKQLEVAEEICKLLLATYPSIVDVRGHEEVSPGRKTDPGPLFPMQEFREKLFGRD